MLSRKGRSAEAFADQLAAMRQRAKPHDKALLHEYAQLAADWASRPSPGLAEKASKLEAEISSQSSEFRSRLHPPAYGDVRRAVSDHTVLVELFAHADRDPESQETLVHYAAYVISQAAEQPVLVELGRVDEVNSAVKAWRKMLSDPQQDDVNAQGRALYRMLMEPLMPYLNGANHLIIAPDGQSNLVPFGALVTPEGKYLLQEFEITYVASGRDLLRRPGAPSSGEVLVFADPVYDLQRAAVLKDARFRSLLRVTPDLSNNRDPGTSKFIGISYARLEATAREAEAVRNEIPRAIVTQREQATESAVKSVRRPLVLHIATHGFVLGASKDPARSNAMLRSGLLLAGVTQGTSGPEQDGVLTAMEMSTLDLTGTELVVLSACETGLGDWRVGDGVYGLRRALFLAGAASEVISLWQVKDDTTADLMSAFYHALATHVPRGEALRKAQLSFVQPAANHSHPFYWAGFELSGAWGPLDLGPSAAPGIKRTAQ